MWLWGRVLVKNDIFTSFLAGAVTAGCILSFTVRFAPIYTREILFVLVLFGLIKLIIDYRNNKFTIEYDLKILPVIIIIGFFFRILHYQNWIIESHDVLYFSPSIEMLNANYFGNIRVPYYYPYEFASTHLLTPAFISSIGFLNTSPNLLYCLEIRYIMSILFLSNILLHIYKKKKINSWVYCIGVYFLLFIFGEEISYNLTVSSFVYVFLIFQIFLYSIEKGKEKELLFFSIMLIAAKGPIFYIAAILSFYLWFNNKNIRFSSLTIFSAVIVFLSLLFMIIIPPPDEATTFSIINPLNKSDLISFTGIQGWTMPDNFKLLIDPYINIVGFGSNFGIIEILRKKYISIIFLGLLFGYIIIKYYLPIFYFYKINKKIQFNIFYIYMIVSLVGWLIVRNGGLLMHQAHAYLLASIVSFLFILMYSSKKTMLYIIVPIGSFFLYGHNPTYISSKAVYEDKKDINGKFMRYADIDTTVNNLEKNYIIKKNDPYWKSEYQAMMLGKRILADDILLLGQRGTQNFVLPGMEKIYEIRDWTLDSLKVNGVPDEILNTLINIIDNVIIGEDRFNYVIGKYLSDEEMSLYLERIKFRAGKSGW